jgi:hypothetical protein
VDDGKEVPVDRLVKKLTERCDELDPTRPTPTRGRGLRHHARDEPPLPTIQAHEVAVKKKKLRILALFDVGSPTALDEDRR